MHDSYIVTPQTDPAASVEGDEDCTGTSLCETGLIVFRPGI